jgi:hypothetical protein
MFITGLSIFASWLTFSLLPLIAGTVWLIWEQHKRPVESSPSDAYDTCRRISVGVSERLAEMITPLAEEVVRLLSESVVKELAEGRFGEGRFEDFQAHLKSVEHLEALLRPALASS